MSSDFVFGNDLKPKLVENGSGGFSVQLERLSDGKTISLGDVTRPAGGLTRFVAAGIEPADAAAFEIDTQVDNTIVR